MEDSTKEVRKVSDFLWTVERDEIEDLIAELMLCGYIEPATLDLWWARGWGGVARGRVACAGAGGIAGFRGGGAGRWGGVN